MAPTALTGAALLGDVPPGQAEPVAQAGQIQLHVDNKRSVLLPAGHGTQAEPVADQVVNAGVSTR